MLQAIMIFLASSFVSFLGSLQAGPVNLFVINTLLNGSKKNAYAVAIGGCIPEFIYCAIAVWSSDYLPKLQSFNAIIKVVFIAILLTIAILFWLKKGSPFYKKETATKATYYKSIIRGFTLAAINPQLLPFWIFIQIYFNSIPLLAIKTGLDKFSYILGAGMGAFLLLMTLISLISRFRGNLMKYLGSNYYYKTLAILFLLIAIHQSFSFK